ncbi:MAG: methylamine utilization protein MauE [Gammaproteobacteria bacterium]|nr:methylamine utilization protein MauE [Gammaproteobacteria bacterium]
MLLDPLIVLVISLGFGALFLSTTSHKIREFAQFRVVLADYELLPGVLVLPAACTVVVIELVLTLLWFSALFTSLFIAVSAILSAALLTLYGIAVGINLIRGRVHISCGCGVPGANNTDQPLSSGILVRNSVLALIALAGVLPILERSLAWFDYVAIVTTLLTASVLYMATSQLLSNSAAMAAWRQGVKEVEPDG